MVAERTKDLEEAKDKAEESDRLKSAFLANMSHEIRTPLNAIMGFIDILEANELDPEERKTVNAIIQTNSDNLLQLINDIIDISIIEANQLVIRKKEFDFHAFLYEIEMRYNAHKDLRNKDVAIIREIPDGVEELNVYSDQMRLRQIYNNLINNAIKFTDRGHIKFGYKLQDQDTLLCFVEDTGIGISEENINKIFRRFHKIEPTAAKVHRGTGLGLSISQNLSELLGGRIWVDSIPGNGSTFFFTIPIR
jgi:signal transduction histidine kinase